MKIIYSHFPQEHNKIQSITDEDTLYINLDFDCSLEKEILVLTLVSSKSQATLRVS
jgi:hypothetical protein